MTRQELIGLLLRCPWGRVLMANLTHSEESGDLKNSEVKIFLDRWLSEWSKRNKKLGLDENSSPPRDTETLFDIFWKIPYGEVYWVEDFLSRDGLAKYYETAADRYVTFQTLDRLFDDLVDKFVYTKSKVALPISDPDSVNSFLKGKPDLKPTAALHKISWIFVSTEESIEKVLSVSNLAFVESDRVRDILGLVHVRSDRRNDEEKMIVKIRFKSGYLARKAKPHAIFSRGNPRFSTSRNQLDSAGSAVDLKDEERQLWNNGAKEWVASRPPEVTSSDIEMTVQGKAVTSSRWGKTPNAWYPDNTSEFGRWLVDDLDIESPEFQIKIHRRFD